MPGELKQKGSKREKKMVKTSFKKSKQHLRAYAKLKGKKGTLVKKKATKRVIGT